MEVKSKAITEMVLHKYIPGVDHVFVIQVVGTVYKGRLSFHVLQKWGDRGSTWETQVFDTYNDFISANTGMSAGFHHKMEKGYVDVTDGEYDGPLEYVNREIDGWLDEMLDDLSVFDDDAEIVDSNGTSMDNPKANNDTSFTVVCINSVGIAGEFSQNAEYSAKKHNESDFYWVTDDTGEEIECLRERFSVPNV